MMVAEIATPRVPAEGRTNQQQQQFKSTTTCGHCSESVNVYQMGETGEWICVEHLAGAVSLAACVVWPDMVSYTYEFEKVLL